MDQKLASWCHQMNFTNVVLSTVLDMEKYPVIEATACFVRKVVAVIFCPLAFCIASRNFLTSAWIKSIL